MEAAVEARAMFPGSIPWGRMVWRLATSYPDSVLQRSALVRSPIYRGDNAPRGRGQPLLLIPGFLVGDWTLWAMAGWLRRLGYRPYLSGIDWNVRAPEYTGELLSQRVEYIVKETNSPLILVGHSLGGMLARFLVSSISPSIIHGQVRQVIAIGAPVHGSPQAAHPFLRLAVLALQRVGRAIGKPPPDVVEFLKKVATPVPQGVGSAAILSTTDEIVDWRNCVDPCGDNYLVTGRHLSLVVNHEVYRFLATILRNLPPIS